VTPLNESFRVYYSPHNYAIPQVMPHAIPQTHSSLYPHRFDIGFRISATKLRSATCFRLETPLKVQTDRLTDRQTDRQTDSLYFSTIKIKALQLVESRGTVIRPYKQIKLRTDKSNPKTSFLYSVSSELPFDL